MDRGQWARHFEGGLVQPGKRILDGGRAGGAARKLGRSSVGWLESGGGAPGGFCRSAVSFELGAFFYQKLYLEGTPKCAVSVGTRG